MGYRIAGRCTDLCSCHTPCPCAFGQTPTGGTCAGMYRFDIQEGEYDDLSPTTPTRPATATSSSTATTRPDKVTAVIRSKARGAFQHPRC
jgi:hypothetical protein